MTGDSDDSDGCEHDWKHRGFNAICMKCYAIKTLDEAKQCDHDYETKSGGHTGWLGKRQVDAFWEHERCTKCGYVKGWKEREAHI